MLVDLCYKVAELPGIYTGVRKVVQGVTHSTTELPEVDLAQLGYRGGKVAQLMRNYFNQAEVDAARKKLAARRTSPHTSVALNTIGQAKDPTRSQGHCIRSLIITQTPKWTEVDIVYRSTELIQKFTADMVLIPMILKELDLAHKPRIYRFYFANCFLTALFAPVLFQHTDPIDFYQHLKRVDPRYFRTFLNASAKFTETQCRYNYAHRVKMWKIAQEKLDCDRIARYCIANGASFNSDGVEDDEEI